MSNRQISQRAFHSRRCLQAIGLATGGVVLALWLSAAASIAESPAASAAPANLDTKHLPNPIQVTDKIISGGLPADDAAFQELRDLGVKTIISVDGAKPDVAAAKKYGLRYVHLPHGYDGISDERVQELAKAVRDLPGPIYVHCHHGKHRSPAAAAAACVTAGTLQPDVALAVLKTAGTSPNYRGLYQCVAAAKPAAPNALDKLPAKFRETAEIAPLAEAMVALEHTHDRLNELSTTDWKATAKDPDADAAHEALLLREHFTELLRTPDVMQQPAGFVKLMQDGEKAAGDLEAQLRQPQPNAKKLAAALEATTANCKNCHQRFRDVPLGEKNGQGSK